MNGTLSEFLSPLDLRGQTWCFVDIRCSGGFNIPSSDAVLFYAVIQGSVSIAERSSGTIGLRPSNVAMILSGETHAVRTNADSPTRALDFLCQEQNIDVPPTLTIGNGPVVARVLCARLKAAWPGGLRRVALPPVITVGTDRSDHYVSRTSAARLETLQASGSATGGAALLTRLAALMLTLALRRHPQCLQVCSSSTATDPIAHALHLIASDPGADWSVTRLARKVGMGRSSFAGRFTEQVGHAPMEVVTERRMQCAAKLLQHGKFKIAEISARTGYQSATAFSRRFTCYFGLSPRSMRRSLRNSKELSASGSNQPPQRPLAYRF